MIKEKLDDFEKDIEKDILKYKKVSSKKLKLLFKKQMKRKILASG